MGPTLSAMYTFPRPPCPPHPNCPPCPHFPPGPPCPSRPRCREKYPKCSDVSNFLVGKKGFGKFLVAGEKIHNFLQRGWTLKCCGDGKKRVWKISCCRGKNPQFSAKGVDFEMLW